MRGELETPIWEEFWSRIDTLNPTGGSKFEKAVNYASNHHETLMDCMLDDAIFRITPPNAEQKRMLWEEKTFYFMSQQIVQKQVRLFSALSRQQKPINGISSIILVMPLLLIIPM